jgi:hypothetical protein
MTAMAAKTYTLKQAHHVEASYFGERYAFDFKAGKLTPASEAEQHALELALEAEEAAARAAAVGVEDAVTVEVEDPESEG